VTAGQASRATTKASSRPVAGARGLSAAAARHLIRSPKGLPNQANRRLGQRLAAQRGWTGVQWTCLHTLWSRESQWNHRADNPTSSAFGVAQFMAFTWKDYGPRSTAAATQIRYGLTYIARRYGTPCGAWSWWWARVPLRGKDVGHWY
jgi:hypothetical protein